MTKVELLSNNYPHFINSALAATNEGGGHKFYEDTIIKHRNQLEWRYYPQILYQKHLGDMCYVDCWWRDTVVGGGILWVGWPCSGTRHILSAPVVKRHDHQSRRQSPVRWGSGFNPRPVPTDLQTTGFCKSDKGDNFVKSPMIKTDRINKRLCCWLYCLLTVQ